MESDPWNAMPLAGATAASHVGPFPYRAFLEAVERAVGTPASAIHVTSDGPSGVAIVEDHDLRFAGPAHLTDYHSPVGSDPSVLIDALSPFPGRPFSLDSLPDGAIDVVVAAIEGLGADFTVVAEETTAVLDLPASHEEWLMSIGKKERHEVRRKRRRFEAEFGEISVHSVGVEAVGAFAEMHRTSPGEKGSFMSHTMERLFTDLSADGARIHRLVCDGVVRAAAFGFETDDGYFYYNSAYDPDAAMASPGIVLLSAMIEAQIARGAHVFDFLKGDEPYKYRHGAQPRALWTVTGVVP